MTLSFFRKNWFMLGLVGVALVTLADAGQLTTSLGLWLGANRGPEAMVAIVFLFSGLSLDTRQIRSGVSDLRGTLLALMLIFFIPPLVSFLFALLPLGYGIIIGLFLVSVMPSTLSSGVVMTGAAGGNMAHALLITIIANILAVFTVPVFLTMLLSGAGESRSIEIDQLSIMIKIAILVILPLTCGLALRRLFGSRLLPVLSYTSICNQIGVLLIVWIALAKGKEAIMNEFDSMVVILIAVSIFHLILVVIAFVVTRIANIPKGRRESIIFMGGQKTLPLSIILQVSLFPEFGIALAVCVLHHIVHLIMDAYLIGYLRKKEV
ncbi:MAG: bile acid:sodium symporter [Desulforhopalus sp.]